MTAVTLPNVGVKSGFTIGESGWADEMNSNMRVLDAMVQLTVVDKDLTTPPGATPGLVYIVGPSATGDWSGLDGQLAFLQTGDDLTTAWSFVVPKAGWRAWVVDESVFYQYSGSAWVKDESSEITPSRYRAVFGDGSSANFFINHSLGTRDLHVTVYRNATPWDDIVCDISRPSDNQIELSGFGIAPATDELVVVVSK